MLEEKVYKTIKKYNMLSFNDKVLVGVSGGPDSITLLKVLLSFKKKYNLSIFIAHLNHMLRGKESDEDSYFVESLAKKLNLHCEIGHCNLPKIMQKEKLTLEEAARKYRYEFYLETTQKLGANKIALGHNADDQVETVLMRLLRGSGVEGLMGIPPVRDNIIRPLIECSRREIEEYCREHKIKYRIDSSNKKAMYFRNKIRIKLLPLLSKNYNKNIKNVILRQQKIISEVSEYLQQETELLFRKIAKVEGQEKVIIDLKKMSPLPLALKRRIIRKSIKIVKGNLYSISFEHNNRILKLTKYKLGEKEIYLPGDLRIKKSYNNLIIYKTKSFEDKTGELSVSWEYAISIPGQIEIEPLGLEIETKFLDNKDTKHSLYYNRKKFNLEFIELIDYDKVTLPLKLTNRRLGDKFYPLKMRGTKKVKEFFIDNKVPQYYRNSIPLLVDNEGKIIWIIGMRLDDRVKITSETTKVLYIKVKNKKDRIFIVK
jgi:tRNA(Ile)-lysidine synthase